MDFHVFSRFFVVFRVFRIFSRFFALPVVFTNSHIFMKFQDFLIEMSTEMSVSLGGILFRYEHGIYKNTADLSRYQCILTKCWLPQCLGHSIISHEKVSDSTIKDVHPIQNSWLLFEAIYGTKIILMVRRPHSTEDPAYAITDPELL